MWLQLRNEEVINLANATTIRFGGLEGTPDNEWDLVAGLPDGSERKLAEFHCPQTAKAAYDRVMDGLKNGTRVLSMKDQD